MQQVLSEVQAVGVKGHDSGPLGNEVPSVGLFPRSRGLFWLLDCTMRPMVQTLACLSPLGGIQPPASGLKKATISGPPRHQSQARPGLVTSGLLTMSLLIELSY